MKLVLIGGGGHAQVVAEVALSAKFQILGVLTPAGHSAKGGLNRLGDDNWLSGAPADIMLHIAIGPKPSGCTRSVLFERWFAKGRFFPSIIAGSAIVSRSADIGIGSIVMHAAIINASTRIGNNCIVNTGSIIEHGCNIGDHSHIGPGSVLAGDAQLAEHCIIGVGTKILPGIHIARGVMIGAGSVVTRAIEEPNSIWFGSPARKKISGPRGTEEKHF